MTYFKKAGDDGEELVSKFDMVRCPPQCAPDFISDTNYPTTLGGWTSASTLQHRKFTNVGDWVM